MACYYHQQRETSATCNTCGKHLCVECASVFEPPTCMSCADNIISDIKKEMIKNIAISVVLMVVGIVISKSPYGALLAGIPYGWSALTKITPTLFVWMPLVGWVIYFFIKLLLAYIIGIFALPFKLYQWIAEMRRVKRLQQSVQM